jgi:L-2-hydroxyglutarate oxidase LhgO
VPGLREVGPEELREIEPHAAGVRALHSPGTGIIDFARVTRSLAAGLVEDGVDLLLGHEVTGVATYDGSQVVTTTGGEVRTRHLISCAGLHSDRVAGLTTRPDVHIVPFRGDYYTLKPEARMLCRGLIYPVPDPSLPFLGVHFTKRHDGEVWAGPNAVLALAREGYRRRDVDWADTREVLGYSGFRALARKYWRTGAAEVWRDAVKRSFVKELQRYVPVRGARPGAGPRRGDGRRLPPPGGARVAARPQRAVPGGHGVARDRRDAGRPHRRGVRARPLTGPRLARGQESARASSPAPTRSVAAACSRANSTSATSAISSRLVVPSE